MEPKTFESKIITEDELLPFVDDEWEIPQPLPNSKFIIRKLV